MEGVAVCRDFAHLAIALCRCMNIPARYCTGHLGDIGVPVDVNPMDFSAWSEVILAGRWYTMEARHNHPRIGRIFMGRGRDAADVVMSTAFGIAGLVRFDVVTDERPTRRLRFSLARYNSSQNCVRSERFSPMPAPATLAHVSQFGMTV
jgi:transglutaminase-like putative cysteine protease